MTLRTTPAFLVILTCLSLTVPVPAHGESARWPAWRGPDSTGIAPVGNPPITWSETENIAWKTALPGEGQSTPVIWDDRLFLQTAEIVGEATEGEKHPQYRFSILCLDRNRGEILWQRSVREARPHEGHHKSTTVAPFSPVTDGEKIWASFGSLGLFCLSMDGEILWEAATIQMNKVGPFGEGSSPVLVGDSIIVLADHEGQSKLFAFDKMTGNKRWERDRDVESSWGTPLAIKVGDHTEIITTAPGTVRSYDVATGKLIWESGGITSCASPSPVAHDGLVYCTTGYKGEAVIAIELGHEGDLTGTDAIRWHTDATGSEVSTPLIYKNRLYVFKSIAAVLSCFDATTGAPLFERTRIPGMKHVYASPLAAGNHIYINGREGTTVVLRPADTFEIVASNTLDEVLDASPVAIGDTLYLRGRHHMYSIKTPTN